MIEIDSLGGGKLECHGPVVEGAECRLSGRELQVDCTISRADYLSGACFGRGVPSSGPQTAASSTFSKQFVPLKLNHTLSSFKPPGVSVQPRRKEFPCSLLTSCRPP